MAANERQELEELRRIDELEKKAAGSKSAEKPTLGEQTAAAGKSALESAGGAAGGYAGAELGAMAGAPLGPVGVLGGGLAGGVVGYYGGEKLQEKIGEYIPESVKKVAGFSPEQRAKERKEMPTASTIGKYAPDVAAVAPSVYQLGRYGITKAADLGNLLLGKKTAKQAGQVGKEAAAAGTEAEKALTQQEAETQRLLAKEKEARAATAKSQAERQQMAAKAAAKAAPAGQRSLRELAGVRTLPEAGAFKPIPQTPTEVGNFLRQQAENYVNAIKTQRNEAAKVGFANAKNEAALKQRLGQYVDTSPLVSEIDKLISKGGSTDYIRSINQLKNDLAATKDFEGLEVIRRRLGDAAFGLPEEGYKAIGQGFAKDMYKGLADQMKAYSSDFEKYLADYARLSKNIEAHGTKVGKGLTETQDAAGVYYAKPAEQVAKDIFSSPEKYKQFVDAVGGNLEIAASAGRKFFAGKLESAKTPEAVEKILKENRELLRQPGMGGAKQDIERRITGAKQDIENYLASLRQSGKRAEAAGAISEEAKTAQKAIAEEVKDLDKAAATKLKNISGEKGAKTLMSDAVNALSSAKPRKAIETFENAVLPKIRDAEAKAGTRLLSDQQIETLRQQVQQLEKIADKTERARVIAGVLTTALLGYGTVTQGTKLLGALGISE
jgi:hypothetical protein